MIIINIAFITNEFPHNFERQSAKMDSNNFGEKWKKVKNYYEHFVHMAYTYAFYALTFSYEF